MPFNSQDGSKSQQLCGGDSATSFPIFSDPIPIYSDPVSQNNLTETHGIPQPAQVLKEKAVTEVAGVTVELKPTSPVVAEMVVSYSVQVCYIILYESFY